MRDGVALCIRREMKTLHPLLFLGVKDLQISGQIARGRLKRPGPEMDLIRGDCLEERGGRPRQRGGHVRLAPMLVQGSKASLNDSKCYTPLSEVSLPCTFSRALTHINSSWRSLFAKNATSRALTSSDSARAISCCKKLNAGRISTGKSSLRNPRRTSQA